MGLFDRSNKEYAKIHIEFDIDKKGEGTVEVEGDDVLVKNVNEQQSLFGEE